MKRTEIMAHAMHNLGSPLYSKEPDIKESEHFFTDEDLEELLKNCTTDLDSLDDCLGISIDHMLADYYKEQLGHFYTDTLKEYFHHKQCPIHVADYSGKHSRSFKTFKELEDALPHTKLYPDRDFYQSDGLHFRLEGKF